jgi:hypothetical protein
MMALLTMSARASDTAEMERDETPEALVVLLAADREEETTARLFAALEAHLNALPVRVVVVEGDFSSDPAGAAPEATMILWLSQDAEALAVLIPELEETPRRVVAEGEASGTQAWFDALAAIIYSSGSVSARATPPRGPSRTVSCNTAPGSERRFGSSATWRQTHRSRCCPLTTSTQGATTYGWRGGL